MRCLSSLSMQASKVVMYGWTDGLLNMGVLQEMLFFNFKGKMTFFLLFLSQKATCSYCN